MNEIDNATVSNDDQLAYPYPSAKISGFLGLKWWVNLLIIIGALCMLMVSSYMINLLKLTTLLLTGASPEKVIPLASFVDRLWSWTLIAMLTTELTYICWMYRAYKNLSPLTGSKTQWGVWWATLSIFVPLLGLWRPAEVLVEIWNKSSINDRSLKWGSKAIWTWWLARIAFLFLWKFLRSQVHSAGAAPGPDIFHFMNALRIFAYGQILWIIATLGGILLLWQMTKMQQEKVFLFKDNCLEKDLELANR